MDLYFDKENLLSFFGQKSNSRFYDSLRMIRKHMDVYFNFEKEETRSDNEIKTVYTQFTQGFGKVNKLEFCNPIVPDRPVKSNFYIHLSNKQSVFLINDDNINKCHKGAILIGGLGDEVKVLSSLFMIEDDYDFEKRFGIGNPDFKKWEDLKKFIRPFTEIILFDEYIFFSSELIESNYEELLRVLLFEKENKVNIIIYTNTEKCSIGISEMRERTNKIASALNCKTPRLTLIKVRHQRGLKNLSEHDRTIFTNYVRFYSGDSFNYFNSIGRKITSGRELNISGLTKRENYDLALNLINDIQNNINFLQRNNPEAIEGDKTSHFLKFD